MVKVWFWLVALLCGASSLLAASTTAAIGGVVTDHNGDPVAGAVVRLEDPPLEASTGSDGRFLFPDLSPGVFRFQAESLGYFPSLQVEVILEADVRTWVEIRLESKETVEESVVVTGTRTPHRIVDAPVRTEVVSGLLCERRAIRTLAEALVATASGVRIESNCQNCGFLSVRLNGLQGQYTQILEDGLPAVSGVSMVYALDQIPTDFLDSIEVVKGGASALYGPSAVGGVINLIRREPRGNSFSLDTQSGWQRGRPESSYGGLLQLERLPGGFSADTWFRDLRRTQIDRDGDGFSDTPRKQTSAGGGTLFRRFADGKARLTLGANLLADYRRGGDSFHLPPEQTQITEMADSSRYGATIRWNHTVSAATFYTLVSSMHYLARSSYYGAGFDPNAHGVTGNPLWVSDAQIGRQQDRHTFLGGFQFQREQVRDSISAYGRHYRDVFRNTGLYLQDEFRLSGRVTLVGGLRADKSSTLAHWTLSPRGNVRLGLDDRWSLRFGLSTGFRAPVIFDEDLHVTQVGGQGLVLENSPSLKEEKSFSRNFAVDYAGAVAGLPFQAGASLFWTTLDGVHVFQEVADPLLREDFRRLQRINGSGSFVRGLELDLNWRLRRFLGLRSGATLQQARYEEPEPDFGSLRYFRTPNRYGFLAADADLPRGLALTFTGDFTGSMVVPHYAGFIAEDRLERSRPFAVWSAMLSRTVRLRSSPRSRMRLYCRFTNLGDSFQRDLDRGPMRDSGYFYGPTQMRTVMGGVNFTY